MLEEIDPLWPESQAGLTCLSCHAIDTIHGKEGNGNYNISDETPSPYLFADSKTGITRTLHDMVLKSNPTVHKNMMLKPFFRSSEYCLTCHKVSLDTPINNYRWLRGQNDYDAWHNSGVALNAARTFYQPPQKRSCQDCHMPMEPVVEPDVSATNGMVKSHRFLSANNALPHIRGDDDSVQYVEDFIKGSVLIDVFAIKKIPEPDIYPLTEGASLHIKPGEEIQLDVIVRNFAVGHTFPGGTNDSNESWIHLEVLTPEGKHYIESGALGNNGYVDPEAHFYNILFVDKNSNPALNRNPQDFHAVVYKRVIGPGTANAARYRMVVPQSWPYESITIRASLNWRKFTRHYTEFVFAHENLPDLPRFEGKEVPDLPIVTISQSGVTIPVGKPGVIARRQEQEKRPDWMRFNDYGIAHLLQGDLKTAQWAFKQVENLVPGQVDGPRNQARVALMEGSLERTYKLLRECETIKPGDPQTAWFWAMAKQKEGLYNEAISALKRVIAYYPEDREAWKNLGLSYFLNGEYKKSLKAYLEVLKIDPEDLSSHLHRLKIYRALGEQDKAAEAEKAFTKYQIDESARQATQEYRLQNPGINQKSQPLHIYELNPSNSMTQR